MTDGLVERVAQAMLGHQMDCELMGQSVTWESRARAAIAAIEDAGYVIIEKEIIDSVRRGDRR